MAEELQLQLNQENRRIVPSDTESGTTVTRNKDLSDKSNGSASQSQWDMLEKEHGGGSFRRKNWSCSSCCPFLNFSFCCKNSRSNVHPLQKSHSEPFRSKIVNNDKKSRHGYSSKKTNKESEPNGVDLSTTTRDVPEKKVLNPDSTKHKDKSLSETTSSVPKLPSIPSKSTGPTQNSSVTFDKMLPPIRNGQATITENSENAERNLELLELHIESVEKQNSATTNGKRPHYRTNGINKYNYMPWNHYHDDNDAIFVVDA